MKQTLQVLATLGLPMLGWQFTELYIGNVDARFTFEIVAALIALLISVVAINLSITPRNRLTPYIGVSFLVVGLLSLIEVFKSKGFFFTEASESILQYSWLDFFTSTFFGVILVTGIIRVSRNPQHNPGVFRLIAYVAPVLMLVVWFYAALKFPSFESISFPRVHPLLLIISLLLNVVVVALIFTLKGKKYCDRESALAKELLPGLIMFATGQFTRLVDFIAQTNNMYDAGNFLIIASYLYVLLSVTKSLSRQSKFSSEVAGARVMTLNVALLLSILMVPVIGFVKYEAIQKNDDLSQLLITNSAVHRVRYMHDALQNYLISGEVEYQQLFETLWAVNGGLKQKLFSQQEKLLETETKSHYEELREVANTVFTKSKNLRDDQKLVVVQKLDDVVQQILEHLYSIVGEHTERLEASKKIAKAQLHSSLFVQFVVIILLLPFMIGLNIWHNRRQIGPVVELTKSAKRIVAGEKGIEIATNARDEIAMLGKSFTALITQLQNAVVGLEERVQERTEALSLSEQRLRNIMDNVGEGIVTVGTQGVMQTVNSASCHMFGYEASELIGLSFYDLITDESKHDVIFCLTHFRVPEKGVSQREHSLRVTGIRKDISEFLLEIVIAEAENVENEAGGTFIFVLRDITEIQKAENALRLNEQRMSRFFDASMEGLLFYEDGVIVDNNKALLMLIGNEDSNVIGRNLVDLVSPECRVEFQKKLINHYSGIWEASLLRNDGSLLPVEIQARAIALSDKNSSIAVVRNISERKKAESAINKQSQFTQRILDTISSLVFVVNAKGEIIRFNKACELITGCAQKEVLGKHIWSIMIDIDDNSDVQQVYRNPVSEDFPCHRQYQWLTKYGEIKVIDWINTAAIANNGGVEYIIATGVDITDRLEVEKELSNERRNLERKIKERTRELDAIFTLSPDGFVMINQNKNIVYANPAFLKMTGMESVTVVGVAESEFFQRLYDLCDPQTGKPRTNLDSCADSEVLHLIKPVKRHLNVTVRTLWDEFNIAGGWVLYFRDVTHETEVDRMKSEFLSTAAHEFRTPLSSILGFSELLLSGNIADDKRNNVTEIIHRQSTNLKTLLDELLDLTRIEARAGKDFRIITDTPEKLVRQVFEDTLGLRKEDHILKLDFPDSWPLLEYDEDKLRQVLNNIISNAYKYSPDGGEVVCSTLIRMDENEKQFGIQLQDQGIGMSPDELKSVGQRFYRADSASAIAGTGLGMSLVKEIMDIFEGQLEIKSETGKGTTVILWFPIVDSVATAKAV